MPYNKPFFVVMLMNTGSGILEPEMAQGYDVVSHNDLHHYKVFHAHKQRDGKYIVCRESVMAD